MTVDMLTIDNAEGKLELELYTGPVDINTQSIHVPLTVNAFTHPGARCICVKDHNPEVITFHIHHILPLANGGTNVEDNKILLCPTSHYNIHHLLRAYVKSVGHVHWDIRKYFSPFARGIALEGWNRIQKV